MVHCNVSNDHVSHDTCVPNSQFFSMHFSQLLVQKMATNGRIKMVTMEVHKSGEIRPCLKHNHSKSIDTNREKKGAMEVWNIFCMKSKIEGHIIPPARQQWIWLNSQYCIAGRLYTLQSMV